MYEPQVRSGSEHAWLGEGHMEQYNLRPRIMEGMWCHHIATHDPTGHQG